MCNYVKIWTNSANQDKGTSAKRLGKEEVGDEPSKV
jgi:hypothetical protein